MNHFKRFLLLIVAFGAVSTALSSCGLPDLIEARQLAREGNALYLDGDYKGAIEKYLKAQKVDPETPNLYLNLGYAYFSIFKPDTEGGDHGIEYARNAIDVFEKHLQRHSTDEAARVFLAKILLKAAPYDKSIAQHALQTFQDLLKENPNDVEARQYLISLFIDCQRYDDAVAFYAPQLKKNPKDIESMKILAIIAEKCGKTHEAAMWYEKRAEVTEEPEKKAVCLYEIGTYIWGLLHYHPDRIAEADAMGLIEKGLAATQQAMTLKKDYAEAMAYTNLLLLKRAERQPTEDAKYQDQMLAMQLREEAGKILKQRKREQGLPVDEEPGGSDGPDAGGHAPYMVAFFLSP